MTEKIVKWIRRYSSKLFHSVGFFPAVIALAFFLLAIFTVKLDDEGWGIEVFDNSHISGTNAIGAMIVDGWGFAPEVSEAISCGGDSTRCARSLPAATCRCRCPTR